MNFPLDGDLMGNLQIKSAEVATDRPYEISFSVKRDGAMFKTRPVWSVRGQMTKRQLLELRDAIDAEIDRVFLDDGPTTG